MQHQLTPPNPATLRNLNINVPNGFSGITYPLYDSAIYPAAGTNQITLFQTPIGQGGKTLADTNMQAAGMVPSPQVFVATGIALRFLSGQAIELLEAAATGNALADVQAFYEGTYAAGTGREGGYLEFDIGQSFYVRQPLWAFPSAARLNVQAATSNATTAAAAQFYLADYAENSGIQYQIAPLALPSNQPFQMTLNWPVAVCPMPSTKVGKVFCTIFGWLYRPVQA